MKRGIPIRASLTVLVLATALPFVSLIAYNTYSLEQAEAGRASADVLRAAKAVATETEDALDRAHQLLSTLSKRPLVRSLDPAHCAPIFATFGELYPEYTNLLTVHRNRDRVCSAVQPPPGSPAQVDPQLYLSETLRSGAFTVGQVTRGVFTGRWITIVAQPVMDERDQLHGVVALAIDLANLPLASRSAQMTPHTQARIVDASGMVIASSATLEPSTGHNFAGTPWLRGLEPGREATGRAVDAEGVERIYGTVPIEGTTWHAAVGIPVDVVYGPVRHRLRLNIAISLVALMLAAALAYMTARRTIRPVEVIAAAVRRAAQSLSASNSEIAHAQVSPAPREIQTLASDFGAMLEARGAAELALRESEERLRFLNSTLEARVAERTHQLQQMNAELDAVNKELESFSYSVSHDLRAPLRAMDGYSQMVQEDYADRLDDEGRRLLDVIRQSSQKMGALIDGLLAFSRLGVMPIAAAEVDMNALIKEVSRENYDGGGSTRAQIKVADLPIAHGDYALIRQVWVNLLSNAIKFAGKTAEPIIEIRGDCDGAENVYSIKDNGTGFDMRYRDKLFGVFQRLHTAAEYPGTGVGLAIVQRIVARHGGRVWAEGKLNEGATFYFTLPKGGANAAGKLPTERGVPDSQTDVES